MFDTAGQTCPKCKKRFKVLADEYGSHQCPKCGYHPADYDVIEEVFLHDSND